MRPMFVFNATRMNRMATKYSVSFNIFYLAEPNKSVTHTHSNNGLSLCTKAIAVRPARVSVRRFKHLQGAFKALCRCFLRA